MRQYEFDALVIGGGAAGLTAAGFAAHMGARTGMVEARKLGGDCTWTGCIPSKTLLKAGRVARQMRQAGKYGLTDTEPDIDFKKVMNHVRSKRDQVYREADAPRHFEKMGIEVLQGRASFNDAHTVQIVRDGDEGERRVVTARYIFICAGAAPAVPDIPGLHSAGYLTSDTLFDAEQLPERLVVIGAGPVGIEMGQALNRLGAQVTVVDRGASILPKDDPELTLRLKEMLQAEGINFVLDTEVERVTRDKGDKKVILNLQTGAAARRLEADRLLVAAGRSPNTKSLNLDAAGVEYSPGGIAVDRHCRTTTDHIYACGDITGDYFLTHMSEHMARVAVANAILKVPKKVDADSAPWCTYCEPELAHVGATPAQLRRRGRSFRTFCFPYAKIDRALTESETEGMIKITATRWRGKILGASVLGAHAGELISEYALAMKNGVGLGAISETIHPYPAWGQGARRAADQWYGWLRPRWLVKGIQKLFGYRGAIPPTDRFI